MLSIYFDLDNLLAQKHLSKNQVCMDCHLQRTQLNNICSNRSFRIDLETLWKLCVYLDCTPNDILKMCCFSSDTRHF